MLISFGILNIKLLIPFVCPVFLRFRRYFRDKLDKQNAYFKIFFSFLSFSSSGFIYLFALFSSYKEKKKNTNIEKINDSRSNSNSILLIRKTKGNENELLDINTSSENSDDSSFLLDEQKKLKRNEERKKIYFILLLTLLQMLGLSFHNIWKDRSDKLDMSYRGTVAVFFEFIFLIIFSMTFLKFQVYIHQKFSLLIIILCLIIMFVIKLHFQEERKNVILNIIYFAVHQLFYCLLDVLGKKYLNHFLDNFYLFMFKIGISGLIPVFLYDIIVEIFFDDPGKKYHGIILYFQDSLNEKSKIFYFIIDLIFGTIWLDSVWLTIHYFSPLHFIILEVLTEFLETFFSDDNKLKKEEVVAYSILYSIIIISTLICTEILILNFWGLNYNTKKYIMNRQKNDSIRDDNNIMESNEASNSLMDEENEENNKDISFD